MFKKFLVLSLTLSFMISPTHAAGVQGLKVAFQELNYSLSVEWDQKDQEFKKEQLKKFHDKVAELQKQGLTHSELMEFAISEVKDESLKRDLRTSFSMVHINKMGSQEAQRYVQETLEKSLSKGASWNGSVSQELMIGIIALAVILVLANRSEGGEDEEVLLGPQPDGSFCGYTEVCEYQQNPHPFADYDDYGYYCEQEYYCVK